MGPVVESGLHPDLVSDARLVPRWLLVRHTCPTVRLPRAEVELESTVVTVAGVDGPVPTALAASYPGPMVHEVLTYVCYVDGEEVVTELTCFRLIPGPRVGWGSPTIQELRVAVCPMDTGHVLSIDTLTAVSPSLVGFVCCYGCCNSEGDQGHQQSNSDATSQE